MGLIEPSSCFQEERRQSEQVTATQVRVKARELAATGGTPVGAVAQKQGRERE